MKDTKFIELLNLYVDHQISAPDAALLEAEIQRNPERRKIYREYCQMQKACSILAESFRPQMQPTGGQVVEFPRRSAWNRATYVMGALAAAACVAVVVVNRAQLENSAAPDAPVAVATTDVANTPVAVVPQPASAPAPASRPALQPAFAAGLMRDEALATTAERAPLDWVNQVNLEPVAIETLRFETRPAFRTENVMLRDRLQPVEHQQDVLPVAWRFQR